jgi:hypothetical protein
VIYSRRAAPAAERGKQSAARTVSRNTLTPGRPFRGIVVG